MPDEFDEVAPEQNEPEFILIDRSREEAALARPKPVITHKTCKRCEQEREIELFSKINAKYYASYCKYCVRQVAKGEYLAEKDKRIEEIKVWKKKNRPKVNSYNKKYKERRDVIKKKIGQMDT